MKEFIDETSTVDGTPINRANLMAIQGFVSCETVINDDGSIVETNANGETLTTIINGDGTIIETFVGQKTITKTTSLSGKTISVEVA